MSSNAIRKSQRNNYLCQVCKSRATINAHLIPKVFVKELSVRPGSNEVHILSRSDVDLKKVSRTGEQSRSLLCDVCDGVLEKYEHDAYHLLRELRAINLNVSNKSSFDLLEGVYKSDTPFNTDIIRFACGIIWKYASLPATDLLRIDIGVSREFCKQAAFDKGIISEQIGVCIIRDLFSAFVGRPQEVFYVATPALGHIGYSSLVPAAWFVVGGFTIYVKLGKNSTDFVPGDLWLEPSKNTCFLVDKRFLRRNLEVIGETFKVRDELYFLNRKALKLE